MPGATNLANWAPRILNDCVISRLSTPGVKDRLQKAGIERVTLPSAR